MLHFLVIGIALFTAYRWIAPADSGGRRIVITQGVVDDLVTQHVAARGREPSAVELNHLIEAYVREEILYREGVRLGLERDDIVVKRRVRQKIEVIAEEDAATRAPTDADLSAYLVANQARFVQLAVLTFEQVFIGELTSGPGVVQAVAVTREALRKGADPEDLGKPTLLPHRMTRTPADLVTRDFGASFAAALEKVPVGEWVGPIDSSFGAHYVQRFGSHAGGGAATRRRAGPCPPGMGKRSPPARPQRRVHQDARRIHGQHRNEAAGRSAMRLLSFLVVTVAVLLEMVVPARADEFKPGYLLLTQLDHETYDVLWKIPAIDEATPLNVKPQFPNGTEALTPVRSTFSRGITVQRWRIRVPEGLDGKAISFSQLSETRIDVLVRLVRLDGTVQLERILPVDPSFVGRPSPGRMEVVTTYAVLGIEHILSGFDHLLFVLALVLLVPGTRRLIFTITAFTVAHSLTLAGATLGWVHVPGPPVEASIALSIVFVASEIVHIRQGRYSVTQHYPWVVAFTFGLLHGFGFAGALAEVGLPQSSIPIALLFFNVGVEIGQLMFVGAVLTVIAAGRRAGHRLRLSQPAWIWRVAPYAIGGLASFWLVERIAAF